MPTAIRGAGSFAMTGLLVYLGTPGRPTRDLNEPTSMLVPIAETIDQRNEAAMQTRELPGDGIEHRLRLPDTT